MLALQTFDKRTKVILILIAGWAALAVAHLFFYTAIKQEELVSLSKRIAWRVGKIPAVRGRILDSNGIPLAWTEMYHDLYLDEIPESKSRRRFLANRLKRDFSVDLDSLTPNSVIRCHIRPQDLPEITKIISSVSGLSIHVRFVRQTVDYPAVRAFLGSCQPNEEGILSPLKNSGVEAQYDSILSGKPGEFVVMLDKNGNWFEGTLKIRSSAVAGSDVTLKHSLQQLKGGLKP